MGWTVTAGGKARLEATAALTPVDYAAIARELGRSPVRARKVGFVAARKAAARKVVETRWNGKETSNTANAGDWIVTNLTPARDVLRDGEGRENTYVVVAGRFTDLYERAEGSNDFGDIHRAKGVVSALELPGGFDIVAPWGERQIGAAGYLLLNGSEVYGASREAFEATYEVVG